MKRTLLVLALLTISSTAYSQSLVTEYSISHYLASNPTSAPITTPYTFLKTSPAVSCNQPRIAAPTTTPINPRFYRWNDPDNAGVDCVFDKTLATTPLFTDPPLGGEYVAKMTAISRIGTTVLTSALSDPSNPFVRGTIPPVVLGLRVTGQ